MKSIEMCQQMWTDRILRLLERLRVWCSVQLNLDEPYLQWRKVAGVDEESLEWREDCGRESKA